MKNSKNGMSLLEVMIGLFLISSTSLIFLKAINLFKTESAFYSEHFLATSLNEKVLETCFQETELNPYGCQTLGLVDASGKPFEFETMVTDGQTNFFRYPDISSKETPVLYKKLKDNFKMNIKCSKDDGSFFEVESGFSWSAKTGKGGTSSVCRFLTFDGEKDVETTYSMTDADVEKRLVVDVFYKSDTTSLNSLVSSIGAQELVMNMGHIYYPCFDLFSADEFYERCQKLESMEAQSYDPAASVYAKCSEGYFEIAKDMLHLLMYLRTKLEVVKEKQSFLPTINTQDLSNVQGYLIKSMKFTKQIEYLFAASVSRLAIRYEKQFDSELFFRDKKKLLQRIFNFYRILYAVRSQIDPLTEPTLTKTAIENRIQKFLKKVEKDFEKSVPAFSRLARQEIEFFKNKTLASKYFIPRTIETLFKDVNELSILTF